MRFLRVCLIIFGLVCMFSSSALAAAEQKITSQEALDIAVKKLNIPESYKMVSSNDLFGYYPTWTFYLEEEGEKENRIEVRVDAENGMIRFANFYNYNLDYKVIAESDAKKVALEYIKAQFSEEDYRQLYLVPNHRWSYYTDDTSHEFKFRRSVNGYPFLDDGVVVSVHSGGVGRFEVKWTKELPTLDEKDVLTATKVSDLYHQQLGLDLSYLPDNSYFELGVEDKKLTLAYLPRLGQGYFDTVTKGFYWGYGNLLIPRSITYELMSTEKKSLVKELNLDRAETLKIAESFISLPANYTPQSTMKLGENFWFFAWGVGDDYKQRIGVVVDSDTGEIVSYYGSEKLNNGSKDIKFDGAKAQQIAEEYLKRVFPSRLNQLGRIKVLDPNFNLESLEGKYEVYFPVLVNGLPVQGRGVSIKLDGEGRVVSHEAKFWYGETPKPEVPIEFKEAQEIFSRRLIKPIAYINHDFHREPILAYPIGEGNPGQQFSIDATSGLVLVDGLEAEDNGVISFAQKHWSGPDIKRLVSMGVIDTVYEEFDHRHFASRSQFVKMLARAMRLNPIYPETNTFSDVSRVSYDFAYIEAVASKGIVLGSDGKFKPEDNITREEIAVILARALTNTDGKIAVKNFKDAGKISPWAKEGVNRAVALGLVKGDTKGNFNPKKKVTQAELAVLVSRVVGE